MSLRNVQMVGLLEHLVGLECLELFLAIMLPLFNVNLIARISISISNLLLIILVKHEIIFLLYNAIFDNDVPFVPPLVTDDTNDENLSVFNVHLVVHCTSLCRILFTILVIILIASHTSSLL